MSRHTPPPRPEPDPQQWEADYELWCQEQDDCEEVNRLLRDAEDEGL